MAGPPLPVDPPPFTGAEPYGIFSAATVIDNVTGAALAGVTYPYRCDPATETWPGPCADPDEPAKTVPGGTDVVVGRPFAVYAFETCPLVAYTERELEARVRESFQRGEQHAVEQALWGGRGDYLGFTQIPDVFDLAPGQTVSADDAVSLAEYWIGLQDGTGVLHINAGAAAEFTSNEVASREGPVYRSPLGHNYVFGGGYARTGPNGTEAGPGAAWMFITRPITLRRSRIRVNSGLRPQSNEHDSRAERVYVATIPCHVAAVHVKLLGAPSTAEPVFPDWPPPPPPPSPVAPGDDPDSGQETP